MLAAPLTVVDACRTVDSYGSRPDYMGPMATRPDYMGPMATRPH